MEYGLVLLWLVTFLAVGIAGLPLASVLFRQFPDRGASVAIPLSLFVVTLVAYWLGQASFGVATLVAGLVVLGAASLLAWRRWEPDLDWWIAGETAAVFAVAFFFLVAIRAVDPAVQPTLGEKFLDFGILKSILRTGSLPPEDMWFAGEPVSYYYVGHLTSALLTMLTGTAAKYAYNLALAGFYAMLVTAAYGLAGALADARGASRRTGGLWAGFFVGFASNLHTLGQVVLWTLPDSVAVPVARFVTGPPRGDAKLSEDAATLLAGPDAFRYWDASRIIEGAINEFPLFAWLNGDLQSHMIGQPFLLLLAALALAYYWTPEQQVTRRRALVFAVIPAVGGLLGAIVTWMFPTVMGLTALALVFAPSDPTTLLPARAAERLDAITGDSRAKAEGIRMTTAVGLGVVVQVLAGAWALPFLLGQSAPWSAAFFPDRSGLGALLLVHGPFLAVFAAYLVSRAPIEDRNGWLQVAILVAGLLAVSVVSNAAAVGLFLPLLVGSWVLLRRGESTAGSEELAETGASAATNGSGGRGPPGANVGFETVLLVAGAGLALIVEFAYVEELAGPGRFNTVFKTYAQVWALWSVAAGAMVASLIAKHLGDAISVNGPRRPTAARVGLALLVFSTSLYGAFALPAHFAGEGYYTPYATAEDPTLDATQFVETAHAEEAEAIQWLDDLEGQPNIVTAAPGGYFWSPADGQGASAPASLTGVPTVMGWHHEIGYRGREPVRERMTDVATIYTGNASQQARLLATYDVEYVYVGPAERAKYGEIGFQGVEGVDEPKSFGEVLIYPVDPGNVSAAPTDEGSVAG